MSLIVNTNQSSLASQRMVANATLGVSSAFERLSSGYRINRAADDAAGLVITSGLTSQVNGLGQATRNANDAISLAQVAEGAVDELFTALQRMRVLTIQAQNGINTEADINALQQEFDVMLKVIDGIAANTEFGGIKLLDGSAGELKFQTGANAGQITSVPLLKNFSSDASGLNISGFLLGDDDTADVLGAIDSAINFTDQARTELGALQNVLVATIRNLSNVTENVSASRSRIRDTDFAAETTALTRSQILQQSSSTVLAQANQRPQAALFILSG